MGRAIGKCLITGWISARATRLFGPRTLEPKYRKEEAEEAEEKEEEDEEEEDEEGGE